MPPSDWNLQDYARKIAAAERPRTDRERMDECHRAINRLDPRWPASGAAIEAEAAARAAARASANVDGPDDEPTSSVVHAKRFNERGRQYASEWL